MGHLLLKNLVSKKSELKMKYSKYCLQQTESVAPGPGPYKHCLQNDGKPDEWLGARVGMWHVGSMSGRGTEVCEELRKRRRRARVLV